MKIGIDVREFKKGMYTGIRNILKDFLFNADTLAHEFVLFADKDTDLEALPEKMKKVVIRTGNTFFWDQVSLPKALASERTDVFFSPYIKTPFRRVCPYVNMICDVIPLTVSKYEGMKAFFEGLHFLLVTLVCSRRVKGVITISEDARRKITEIFNLDTKSFNVVYPSIDVGEGEDPESLTRYGISGRYLLYLGNFKPHKNLIRLVAAYELLPKETKENYKLVLAGGSSGEITALKREVEKRSLQNNVIIVGRVSEDEKRALMRRAHVFVFPSLAEGFGIPPLEAMAMGVPVAVSCRAPMTEVLGDAALYFDPMDAGDISRRIVSLIEEEDLRERCVSLGRKRVKKFIPKDMADSMTNILVEAGIGKILCVSSEFPPMKGGISTMVYNLWMRLPSRRIVILTAGSENKDNISLSLTEIIRRNYSLETDMLSRTKRTIFLIREIGKLCANRNVRMIHAAQIMSAGISALIVKILRGIPYVVYVYSADILEFSGNPFMRLVTGSVLSNAESIISCSEFAKGLIHKEYPKCVDKTTALTPAVDTARFGPEWSAPGIKSKYGIPNENKVFLSISRLAKRKGHDTVIKALKKVIAIHKNITYVIAGEGEERQALEDMVEENGLTGNVVFTGEIPEEELVYFYTECDIFILVPRYIKEKKDIEGFGMVFLEANACSKPVIAGRSGGVAEAVVDGETGLLVDPENVDEVVEAMNKLFLDEEYSRKLGAAGRERVLKDFTWPPRAGKLWMIVREIEEGK